ncbi:MAG: hypothetical protein JM58_16265 [Peptococcaceae bacterium BICA1-8]|nr:MAG: hypothetical protein JM58_16265 [Peptococcaceae bacterium BICA1-8]
MEKSTWKSIVALILLVGMFTLVACSAEKAEKAEDVKASPESKQEQVEKTVISIATANLGTGFYTWGNAFAQLWNKELPDLVKASAQATAGSEANIGLLQQKEVNVSFLNNLSVYPSYRGIGQFEGQEFKDMRMIAGIYYSVGTPVTRADSGITTYEGLKGKKFAVGAAGSGFEGMAKEALAAHDIDYIDRKDLTPVYIGYTEVPDQLKNKFIDGGWFSGPVPQAALSEVATTMSVNYLSVTDPEVIKKWKEKYPWWSEISVPKGTYPGQNEDIKTMGIRCFVGVRADMNEELVYQLTKTLFEKRDQMFHIPGVEDYFTLDAAPQGILTPLHPGAERYYKEKGIEIPTVPK